LIERPAGRAVPALLLLFTYKGVQRFEKKEFVMSETNSHKRAKSKAAGGSGNTEVRVKGNMKIDAVRKKTATEIERSGTDGGLTKAARRLKISGKPQKVLQVPHKDMAKAVKAMKKIGVGGTVKNMGGTKRRSVPKKK